MGSNQSSRRLEVINEEAAANFIGISDALVSRLIKAQVPQEPVEECTSPITVTSRVAQESTLAVFNDRPTGAQYQAGPGDVYPSYTISALEMKQQKERELAQQEKYWQNRLDNLANNHEKINYTMEAEYQKALRMFDDCRVIQVQGQVQPCIQNKLKVLKCYQDNPKQTLQCANLVEEFSNCVDQRRASLLKCN